MRKYVLAFIGMVSFPVAASAEDILRQQVSNDACAMIVNYQPDNDVSATYQAGVDVHGKPVVEADLAPSALQAPDEISFDLTVDMAQYLGVTTTPKPEGQIGFGRITVKGDGQVLLDGQPLESQQETALRALCEQEKAAKTEANVPLDKPSKPPYNR